VEKTPKNVKDLSIAVTVSTFVLQLSTLVLFGFLSSSGAFGQATFHATPLNEFQPGELYLGAFPGFLYDNSNLPPGDHDAAGRIAAARVQPMDAAGNVSSDGKIVVIGIGMSNWTLELCTGKPGTACTPSSFMATAARIPKVNHRNLVLVNCAIPSQVAMMWLDDSYLNYTACQKTLLGLGLTEAQVQVVLYKDANPNPKHSLTSATVCATDFTSDACNYERFLGQTARFLKTRYVNVQQMFVHSRIYAGYANVRLNPEPFAYEYGFATKWFVNAQIQQLRTGIVDPVAGDLSFDAAPWVGWGPYLWGSGSSPRKDGTTWVPSDYGTDRTHPGPGGTAKVAHIMLLFYFGSPYSPWFR
jgi:hypothetical protein